MSSDELQTPSPPPSTATTTDCTDPDEGAEGQMAREVQKDGQRPPLDVRWEGINFSIDKPVATDILKDVHGYVPAGKMLAIMGPSGAGKTSLLSMLSGKIMPGSTSGSIFFSQTEVEMKTLQTHPIRHHISLVEQNDLFIDMLTIREHLMFHADLRLHMLSHALRVDAVKKVVSELRLEDRFDTRIAFLSGGERKRVSVAEELLNDPPLLLLDEPTSGLDSYMAKEIITTLKNLNKTIIMTIHQPSTKVFELFDYTLLIAKGQNYYMGPTSGLVSDFEARGSPCPPYCNPAEFALELLTDPPPELVLPVAHAPAPPITGNYDVQLTKRDVAPWWMEILAVFKRTYIERLRLKLETRLNFIGTILITLITSLLYWRMSFSADTVQNRMGAVFFFIFHPLLMAIFMNTMSIIKQHFNLMREFRVKHLYRLGNFYFARVIGETPIQFIFPFMYVTGGFWMMNISPSFTKYIYFWLTLTAATFHSEGLGYFCGTLGTDMSLGITYATVIVVPFFMLSGLTTDPRLVPVWLQWIKYISVFYYAFRSLSIIVWEDVELEACTTGHCKFSNGNEVLEDLVGIQPGETEYEFVFSILMNLALGVAWRLLGYLRLHIRHIMNDSIFPSWIPTSTSSMTAKKVDLKE